jgi:uncharacterized membrane protein
VTVADAAGTWGGATAGIIAAAVFVVFSVCIVVERVRRGRRQEGDRRDG